MGVLEEFVPNESSAGDYEFVVFGDGYQFGDLDLAAVVGDDLQTGELPYVPHADVAFFVDTDADGPALEELAGDHRAVVAFQLAGVALGEGHLGTPHVDVAFVAHTHYVAAVLRTVVDAAHAPAVLAGERADVLALGQVPQQDVPVHGGRGQHQRVQDLHHVQDHLVVALEAQDLHACAHVPLPERVIVAG